MAASVPDLLATVDRAASDTRPQSELRAPVSRSTRAIPPVLEQRAVSLIALAGSLYRGVNTSKKNTVVQDEGPQPGGPIDTSSGPWVPWFVG